MKSAERFGFTNYDELMKEIYNSFERKDYLNRIDLNVIDKTEWLHELRTMGISYSTLFPDLDGLARDIRSIQNRNVF